MKTTRVNENAICKNCLTHLDAATSMQNGTPSPGDLGICIKCKTVSQYDKDLCLTPITKEFEMHLQKEHTLTWAALKNQINLLDNFIPKQ